MKTIKELNDPKYSDEFGYKQALKDVIKLIDELEKQTVAGFISAKELKERIEG